MRIAVIHAFYSTRVPSGENMVVSDQQAALLERGHDARLFSTSTDELLLKKLYPLQAATNVALGTGYDPSAALADFRPDVVHVHNLFPSISTGWLDAWRHKLVSTVHNYRALCANGYLYRDGGVCVDCQVRSTFSAVRHRCFQGSALASLPLAIRNRGGPASDKLLASSRTLILLSDRAKKVFVEYGLPGHKIQVIPNFVRALPSVGTFSRPARRRNWLFVGRLSEEKGIRDLVQNWPAEDRLDIVGDGPLAQELEAHGSGDVRLLGGCSNDVVRQMMLEYEGLFVPSKWYEGMPTTYIEALAAGLPVIALEGNSAADDVEHSGSGAVLRSPLSRAGVERAISRIRSNPAGYSSNASKASVRFSEPHWLDSMEKIYREVSDG